MTKENKKGYLTMNEILIEDDYVKTLSKQEKKEYKKKSVEEKRQILAGYEDTYNKKIEEKNKDFKRNLKKVPGFRSGKPWKMVIASLVYFMIFVTISTLMVDDNDKVPQDEPKQEVVSKDEKKEDKPKVKKEIKKEAKSAEKKAPKKKAKPLTDEQKLKKSLKKNLNMAEVKNVDFNDSSNDSDVTIELEGKSNMSNKTTTRGFKMGIVEALWSLKKSGIDVNQADIYVYHQVNDGMKDKEQLMISTRWSKDTIDQMEKDDLYTLPDNIESHSESTFIHPLVRKNSK